MELAQAIPSDQVAYAIASSSAFAAEMASSLAAGNTPAWYQALPTDVQSLLPEIYPAMVTPTPTPTPSSSAYVAKSSSVVETSSSAMVTPYPTGSNSTTVMPTMSATGSVTVSLSPSGSASPSPETPPFEGTASKMSVGAGLGAAVLLGLLAL